MKTSDVNQLAESKLILPIFNKRVKTFKGPAWYLDHNISMALGEGEAQGLVLANIPTRLRDVLPFGFKCIVVSGLPYSVDPSAIDQLHTQIVFSLNTYRKNDPIAAPFAFVLHRKRKWVYQGMHELISGGSIWNGANEYGTETGSTPADVNQFYKLVDSVSNRFPRVRLILKRFNSSLYRDDALDRIVDLCICLESLMDGNSELRFRFAASHSWVAERDSSKREETFKILQNLYDGRSKIVHEGKLPGNPSESEIENRLESYDSLARRIIGYHLLFLHHAEDFDSWFRHQRGLILGTENRIDFQQTEQ